MQTNNSTPLKTALDKQGRKYTWLADELAVDPSTVSKWISGRVLPAARKRERIAQLLGVDEAALF